TEAEKVQLCKIVTDAKADYIKTSTGFGSAGATVEDVVLFRKECGADVKIKAAGGIRTVEDAEKMLEAGADRLGSSALLAK
ncbi:MAG: 2-deoxyribose-5-phosphate aldolase, partial [Peptococcaceae bacterium]|nr:2-deoxyribose-5-phosphate aldolase [Peptococcaceae bacterium]